MTAPGPFEAIAPAQGRGGWGWMEAAHKVKQLQNTQSHTNGLLVATISLLGQGEQDKIAKTGCTEQFPPPHAFLLPGYWVLFFLKGSWGDLNIRYSYAGITALAYGSSIFS